MEMLITLELHDIFDKLLHTYTFEHCRDTGMQNVEKALLSISLVDHGHLLKMLITLEPHGVFSLILLTYAF